ncbi:MAG: PRC-barrel domain-containing protein [Rhizobiaceae bacterium]|jgi:sporulation protein YlmC with PRC-barrel domain|nr:PRC-barrel domain-containing protein [Rhizobiaceae bacterium]
MKNLAKTVLAAAGVLFLAGATTSTIAIAEEQLGNGNSTLMSYAPQASFDDGRFGQFDFDGALRDQGHEHELNDAWLGMSAYSSDGRYVGYIEDAILDENGYVTELVVGTPEGNIAVQLEAKYAELQEDRVNLAITGSEFASILTDGQVVSALQ